MINYDSSDITSIYEYAKKLEGKTFKDVCDEDDYFLEYIVKDVSENNYQKSYENKKRKGGLGQIIEERYFHYKIDNTSEADFFNANVELKVTPYKINKNGTLSAKERLIISMINYFKVVDMDFYNSNAWKKLENLLLIYYLWDPKKDNRLEYLINYIYMFTPDKNDLKIIENDFYKIRQKVIDGKAHELSEGDTLYLGAATKSSNSNSRTKQPFSNIPAKPRAFSLKTSYMTYILNTYILSKDKKEDKILRDKQVDNFEAYVENQINRYKFKKDSDLFYQFFGESNPKDKNKYSRLAYNILGVKTKNAEEFKKANIIVKSLRVEKNNKIKESISFPNFNILELISQEWQDSDIYNFFNETKFLFIIYKKEEDNYYLQGSKFWNMPIEEIDTILRDDWEKTKKIFKEGIIFDIDETKSVIKNNLPKKGDTRVIHVRPHAQKSAYLINGKSYGNGVLERDSDLLPNGDKMTKQCFWLNNNYIVNQIFNTLK